MNTNTIALIALAKEFCEAVMAEHTERTEFVDIMLRLLPRLYITASDINDAGFGAEGYIEQAMDEATYGDICGRLQVILGEDDTFLEVFVDDMKYSDTPIAATISEGLADISQVLYNFISTVREAPEPIVDEAVDALHTDFRDYWSQTLCNVLRALNAVKYQ